MCFFRGSGRLACHLDLIRRAARPMTRNRWFHIFFEVQLMSLFIFAPVREEHEQTIGFGYKKDTVAEATIIL